MDSLKLHTDNHQPAIILKSCDFPNNDRVIEARTKISAPLDATAAARGRKLVLIEAGLVEISGLSFHERFLCRLTISCLNLLRVIAEQEGCPIEDLNAARVCDWFLKDKLKREQNLESAGRYAEI